MINLIIDNRENIKELLSTKLENTSFENLTIGDYCFKIDDTPFIIIERKTIADYAASIKDGRHREQKKRLQSQSAYVLYLVEGSISKDNSSYSYNKVNKDTIVSSIINTILRDKINVFHTSDINETIFFIESLYRKIEKQGNSFLDSKSTYTEDLINTVKITKQKNIDENISFQMMMNCIPGISSKVSSRLSNKYKNMKEFLDTLNSIENDELRMDFIQNIKLETNGKSRKISKNVAENIIKFIGYHSE